MLVTLIVNLLNAIRVAETVLIQFLTVLLLPALLIALPWLLRELSVLIWLAAAFVGIQTIQTLYSPTTADLSAFALKFAAIFLMVAWAGFAFKSKSAHLRAQRKLRVKPMQPESAMTAGGLA